MLNEKPPLLRHPEVAKEPDKYKYALEAEQLAYKYKFTREAMLSIYDETKKYFSFENILDYVEKNPESKVAKEYLDFFQEPDKKTFKIKLRHIHKESEREAFINKHPQKEEFQTEFTREKNYSDFFRHIWTKAIINDIQVKRNYKDKNPELYKKFAETSLTKELNSILTKGIKNNIAIKFPSLLDKKEEEIRKETIINITAGTEVRFSNLLGAEFVKLCIDINKIKSNSNSWQQIKEYHDNILPSIKDNLNKIRQAKRTIGVVKSSKTDEAIIDTNEIANLHGIENDLAEFLRDIQEIVLKEELGVDIKLGIQKEINEVGTSINKDFISAYVNYHHEMKHIYRMLEKGEIVETDDVKKNIETAMGALTKNPPTIVYLHGDFGTGKTALAKHISKTRFGKEPEVVAGHKFLEPDALTEEFKISQQTLEEKFVALTKQIHPDKVDQSQLAGLDTDKIFQEITKMRSQLRENIIGNIATEKNEDLDTIRPKITDDIDKSLDILFTNQVQGRYVLNAMYRAMLEGRPLIIDEANAISPDVLIAFNDILTKKIGDKIKSKSIGEFIIKNGYCIMWTGNTGERYHQARFNDIDPATYSRILPIHVQYLPQSTPTALGDSFKRLQLSKISDQFKKLSEDKMYQEIIDSKEAAKQDQIFQVLMLKLLNNRTGCWLTVPENDRYRVFKDIYKLSYASKLIMNLFEASITSQDAQKLYDLPIVKKILGSQDPEVLVQTLQKTNLTMRELIDNIIGGYLDENGRMDIEYYAFKFVKKLNLTPEEQVIVYALLKRAGFFDNADGWPDYASANITDAKAFNKAINIDPTTIVKKYQQIRKNGEVVNILNTEGKYHLEYFTSLETLQMFFGYLPPTKPEDYNQLQAKQFEATEDKERGRWTEKFLKTSLKFRNQVLPLMKNQTELKDFSNNYFKLTDEGENLSGQEYLDHIKQRYEFLIKTMNDKNMLTNEEYSKTAKMSLEEVDKFINNILDSKEKK